jgi:hypothetical protein
MPKVDGSNPSGVSNHQSFTFNADGSAALAELMVQMAMRLDHAVELVGRPDNKDDKRPYGGIDEDRSEAS